MFFLKKIFYGELPKNKENDTIIKLPRKENGEIPNNKLNKKIIEREIQGILY